MLKKKFMIPIKFGLGLCLLFPIGASAHLISITATQPFPATVATSSTTNAVYQVTNLTSHVTLTIVDKSDFPNSISIANSTCGNPIGPGKSCFIELRLVAPSTPQTISTFLREWAKPSADGVQSPINVTVTGTTPVTLPPVAVAVGKDSFNALGLIVASTDGGTTWKAKSFANNLNETLGVASCINGTTQDLCLAAGPATTGGTLFIPISTDGGNTWSLSDTSAVDTNALINAASCAGNGSSNACIVVGQESIVGTPYLIQSTQSLNHWNETSITADSGTFNGASCTGTDLTNIICVASGHDTQSGSAPLLAVTSNGFTWNTPSISGFSTGSLGAVSCTGSGSTAICAVITNNGSSSVASSVDGGTSWTAKTISGFLPGNPAFSAISCTGSGSSAVCIAAGSGGNVVTHPLIVKSTDGANTWTTATISGFMNQGSLNSVSCTGNGSTAICVAVGQDTVNNNGLIATSRDGGNTWTTVTTPVMSNTVFQTASCNGSYCLAAGHSTSTGTPVLAQSLDGAQTWSVVSSIASTTSAGILVGSATLSATTTSSSSSLSNALSSKIIKPKDQLKKFIK